MTGPDEPEDESLLSESERKKLHVKRRRRAERRKRYLRGGSSVYRGVTQTSANTWQAQITHKRKNQYIGMFRTAHEAARAYDRKAKDLLGDTANTNFSSSDDGEIPRGFPAELFQFNTYKPKFKKDSKPKARPTGSFKLKKKSHTKGKGHQGGEGGEDEGGGAGRGGKAGDDEDEDDDEPVVKWDRQWVRQTGLFLGNSLTLLKWVKTCSPGTSPSHVTNTYHSDVTHACTSCSMLSSFLSFCYLQLDCRTDVTSFVGACCPPSSLFAHCWTVEPT